MSHREVSKYALQMFLPKRGKLRLPTALLTATPFDRCPSCESDRSEVTMNCIRFACGMVQMITDGDEFAVSSTCPYSMAAVHDLRSKRLSRPGLSDVPATLTTFSPETFTVGDKVRWVSQSAGRETSKRGVVVAIVPPEARPEAYIPDGMRKNSANGYGRARPHTTYLIRVAGKGSMAYWPRVHFLEKI
jgi:hypothetical protein